VWPFSSIRIDGIVVKNHGKRRIEGMKSSRWCWYLDEMFVKINCERYYLWRAVDQESEVLESFVTNSRDKKATLEFLKKAMRKHGQPEVIVTDRLRSYRATLNELGADDRQETGRWLNNRAENSPCHSDDESGRCSGSGACEVCRNSPQSQITSTKNAASPADPSSRPTAPPLSPSGMVSAQHKGQPYCPW